MPTLFESAYHQFKSDEWIKFRLSELQSNYNKPHHEKNDIKASETILDDDHWHAIPHTELFDGKIIIVCVKNTSWGEEGISYLIFRLIPDIQCIPPTTFL